MTIEEIEILYIRVCLTSLYKVHRKPLSFDRKNTVTFYRILLNEKSPKGLQAEGCGLA